VESEGCPAASNLNRDQIYRFIRSKDPNGVISKKLLEWHGSYECEVNEQSWNGYAYECYLCDREFRRLSSLNQHVNSPTRESLTLVRTKDSINTLNQTNKPSTIVLIELVERISRASPALSTIYKANLVGFFDSIRFKTVLVNSLGAIA
jgi:hypothetical protein